MQFIEKINFEKRGGLLPVIVQESQSLRILMLGYVNKEALEKSINTALATFYSTSRKSLWTKGETSGDYLKLNEILVDCDEDALIYMVSLQGEGACHTLNKGGSHRKSCFFRKLDLETNQLTLLPGEE
jgi:phosphoribosyl-AMP cyclohydrolase